MRLKSLYKKSETKFMPYNESYRGTRPIDQKDCDTHVEETRQSINTANCA
jgi:hypothetical protein